MKIILVATLTVISQFAFADHSLKDAMRESLSLNIAVEAAIKAKGVVCDLETSMQLSTRGSEKNEAWRQVALCYDSKKAQTAANNMLSKGNGFGGIYGVPADAILDVTYSFISAEAKADRLLEISIK